jgi:hypothetical protein
MRLDADDRIPIEMIDDRRVELLLPEQDACEQGAEPVRGGRTPSGRRTGRRQVIEVADRS